MLRLLLDRGAAAGSGLQAPKGAGRTSPDDLDYRHHSQVFVAQDMAMDDKFPGEIIESCTKRDRSGPSHARLPAAVRPSLPSDCRWRTVHACRHGPAPCRPPSTPYAARQWYPESAPTTADRHPVPESFLGARRTTGRHGRSATPGSTDRSSDVEARQEPVAVPLGAGNRRVNGIPDRPESNRRHAKSRHGTSVQAEARQRSACTGAVFRADRS